MDEYKLYSDGRDLIDIANVIIRNTRRMHLEDIHSGLKRLSKLYGPYAESVALIEAETREHGIFPDANCLALTISQILESDAAKDYIMVADYLELSFKPMILQVQEGLRIVFGNIGATYSKEIEAANLLTSDVLSRQLKDVKPYDIEETSTGHATLALEDSNGRYYFHSNVDPVVEADELINDYYDPRYEEYILIGTGLGYLILSLLKKDAFSKLTVYENDARMLKSMISYHDVSAFIKGGRLKIILDDKLEHLTKACQSDSAKVIIHEPSIRNIRNDNMRTQLYRYFYKEMGIRRNLNVMQANFYQNYRNCKGNVDELKDKFEGKRVVMVAAGPSVSKHYDELKNLPEDVVVIAVSTIYRKLLAEGIRPDFVVHIDPQIKTYGHLKDINEDIPLLVLSTAFEGCARLYPGKSYIIYQEGYYLAEQEALKGYQLYETGGSVSCVALEVAYKLGAKEIVLIGLDLAYTDGLAHAKGVSKQ
ncbi:MAG: motility associated factor glycosyltransferase family protein, partial [Lachnospiraceae bacterium]|nr:motility associated factor glycosyltransferase family protein [Lachnospiraceae bacterium]